MSFQCSRVGGSQPSIIAIVLSGRWEFILSVELHRRVASAVGLPAVIQEVDNSEMSLADMAGFYPQLQGKLHVRLCH